MPGRDEARRKAEPAPQLRAFGDEIVSQLPYFKTKPSTDFPGWLIVNCVRPGCGEPFLVVESEWYATKTYHSRQGNKEIVIEGRTCPYCSKVGRPPDGHEEYPSTASDLWRHQARLLVNNVKGYIKKEQLEKASETLRLLDQHLKR